MTMSQVIEQARLEALRIVHTRTDHWLPPDARQRLYYVLDPRRSLLVQSRVRSWLEYLTASYVLPFWSAIRTDPQQVWGEDNDTPEQMIQAMTAILQQTADLAQIRDQANHWLEVSDFSAELPNSQFYPAWCVYDATLSALWYLLGGDFFERASLSNAQVTITDRYSDTANWAAIAYAGGVWKPDPTQEPEYGRVVGVWDYERDETRQRRRVVLVMLLQEPQPKSYKQPHP
jgi:hypothetical protein